MSVKARRCTGTRSANEYECPAQKNSLGNRPHNCSPSHLQPHSELYLLRTAGVFPTYDLGVHGASSLPIGFSVCFEGSSRLAALC